MGREKERGKKEQGTAGGRYTSSPDIWAAGLDQTEAPNGSRHLGDDSHMWPLRKSGSETLDGV
ncbi:hypothetical protein C8034_v002258 [Colletotrichum sidae]|uniref:Uncharacterized protein n=3 Tax=Colletotrichum orbiculare species complex TaxID=2707354 RepID=A0A4R8QS99_COLTR|nr:hypothetical protein C8035_v007948 [Colletotrichum spinosum]TDZ37273.1 hypothetical protein CTRI78_v011135 [Colletotrichum trifolii]TEA14555.1 hypothetical protein C8034_v002258 [Colletotrichum sidae]